MVAYFSWSGNTRRIATQIRDQVGCDIFEIASVDTYPTDYDECVEQARQELERQHRPGLKSELPDLGSYDVVFIGYPNWWGTIPMPVATFLSKCDSADKTIAPFCAHGGGGLERSVADIKKLCPRATVLDGLAVGGGHVRHAQNEIAVWLRKTGMAK